MKIRSYQISSPIEGVCKQYSILAQDASGKYSSPIVYLQRPKWIALDKDWEKIVSSIEMNLPIGTEIGELNGIPNNP